MTRKKKTPPAERRELERQRRINAPEEREKRKAAIDEAKARAARERAVQPDPVIEREPEPAPVPDAPVAAPYTGFQAARGTLKFTDAGDAGGSCRRYQVQYPARMDIQGLFNAIRAKSLNDSGLVYISTNLAEAGPENYQLSYEYADQLFTRLEDVSRNKKSPALADLLGHPIMKLQAAGGYGRMDYFVNICMPNDPPEGGAPNA